MTTTGLRIAQVAAVVFAVGLATWIVILAHEEANPERDGQGDAPAEAPAHEPSYTRPDVVLTEEQLEELSKRNPSFFATSKSGMPFPAKSKDEQEAAKKKPVFLPSSKSIPISESLKPDEKAKSKQESK